LTGNWNWIISWRGFPRKGNTKNKAPVGRYGGFRITVRNVIQTVKNRSEGYCEGAVVVVVVSVFFVFFTFGVFVFLVFPVVVVVV
jgi:hypothetical protein